MSRGRCTPLCPCLLPNQQLASNADKLSSCRELAEKGVGRVFATDALITTLMCATRSVYSWDIIVERQGDFLFFDKRDGSNLDLLTGKPPQHPKT